MLKQEIETIDIDIEEMNIIEREISKFPFPVCNFSGRNVIFNKLAREYVPSRFFKWYINDEWCVLRPCDPGEPNTYKMHLTNKKTSPIAQLPVALRGNKLMFGYHKLYKTKNGIAFKRYELLEEGGR